MSKAIEKLNQGMKLAMSVRPKIGGFPYLAEALRMAGALKNIWTLPSCQSVFIMKDGNVVSPGTTLVAAQCEIPKYDREAFLRALRTDQVGKSTFPEFLQASWNAGIIGYEVDFTKRVVTYFTVGTETYTEEYPQVEIKT